jgi:DNA-binding SARP family transcriptional activator
MSALHSPVRFTLRLFGDFALSRDGQPCELSYNKGRALLAYLAVETARTHSRTDLASIFWPHLEREAALTNLRQVLRDLRRALAPENGEVPPLQVNRDYVRIDPDSLEIDAADFAATCAVCPASHTPTDCTACQVQMESLVGRYRGTFLSEIELRECQEFEAWQQSRREDYHLRALDLLARLLECHERNGALDKALQFALRLIELAPTNEETLRRTMRLLAQNGRHAEAIVRYDACRRVLQDELGMEPAKETSVLAQLIRRGELPLVSDWPANAALPPVTLERHHVTVLYCELMPVDESDPDAAQALLHDPQARCGEILRSHGHLVQIHDNSLLAYFGYPQAREDAAPQAIRAALKITCIAFSRIEVRIGVHTGWTIGRKDTQVADSVGTLSALAIRLGQSRGPGDVTISTATQHLVAGHFDHTCLGQLFAPGMTQAPVAFRVTGENGAKSRIEAAARLAPLSPLVGRESEVAALSAAWRDACSGMRHIVLLRGEAGIGKSRLVQALKDSWHGQTHAVQELHCSSEHTLSPFHPLAELLESSLGFAPNDTPTERFDKLATYSEIRHAKTSVEALPLLARVLALPLRAPYREPLSPPHRQREMTLQLLLDYVYELALRQPLLLVIEDLHWADASTLELLDRFVALKRAVPLLAIFTARPEFHFLWRESHVRTLNLNPLDDDETAALIVTVTPTVPRDVVHSIVERADGIPLFIEELARSVAGGEHAGIPETLHDLFAARLDALGVAKGVAQAAATIGREFDVALLQRISRLDIATLIRTLHQLKEAGLLLGNQKSGFRFKHALMHDAAYGSQTRSEREMTHLRIAVALKLNEKDERPEILAQHWAAGGETHEAITCWIEAGRRASSDSASSEAVSHFKSGLVLLETLPSGMEKPRLERALQIDLGTAAFAAQGYASTEGARAFERVMDLYSHDTDADLFPAAWGLWAGASSRAGYEHAHKLAHRLPKLAGGEAAYEQQGYFAVGNTLYWQGEFVTARKNIERALRLYHPSHHERHVTAFGEDGGVTAGSYHSWILWFLGFPDQAQLASTQALALARQFGHPYSLAYALTFAAILRCRLRHPKEAADLAQETLELADRHSFPLWEIGANISRGWELSMQHHNKGAETLRQCVEATRATMGGVTLMVLGSLAEAEVTLCHYEQALEAIAEAFEVGKTIGDCHAVAELFRLKGEALLNREGADVVEAEACFTEALSLSRKQRAKSLELRVTTSLARLWRQQDKHDNARRILEGCIAWFSEGFETPDLQDARELLDTYLSLEAQKPLGKVRPV